MQFFFIVRYPSYDPYPPKKPGDVPRMSPDGHRERLHSSPCQPREFTRTRGQHVTNKAQIMGYTKRESGENRPKLWGQNRDERFVVVDGCG